MHPQCFTGKSYVQIRRRLRRRRGKTSEGQKKGSGSFFPSLSFSSSLFPPPLLEKRKKKEQTQNRRPSHEVERAEAPKRPSSLVLSLFFFPSLCCERLLHSSRPNSSFPSSSSLTPTTSGIAPERRKRTNPASLPPLLVSRPSPQLFHQRSNKAPSP